MENPLSAAYPVIDIATDIANATSQGWAIEFRQGAKKTDVCCVFRQYGTPDVHSICRSGPDAFTAFTLAKTVWLSFLNWQTSAA